MSIYACIIEIDGKIAVWSPAVGELISIFRAKYNPLIHEVYSELCINQQARGEGGGCMLMSKIKSKGVWSCFACDTVVV